MVQENKQWYRIRQVAQQTGLTPQLIRKWEERYQAITPHRLENGYRIYHQDDVIRLLQLKRLVDDGYSIKNAVLLLNNAAGADAAKPNLAAHDREMEKQSTEYTALRWVQDESLDSDTKVDKRAVEDLLGLGEKSETSRMNSLLEMELAIHGIHHVVYAIIIPFLRQVGALWENGDWTEYQEHIASLEVRDFLVNFRSRTKRLGHGPMLLAACVPGERHDIMLQIILLEATIRGWKTNFLGASPAENALADAVQHLSPDVVIVSVTTHGPLEEQPLFLQELSELSTHFRDVQFYIGGPGLDTSQVRHLGLVTSVHTVDEFLHAIDEINPETSPTRTV
ncbi:MerR family transcriptional regulator [Alicyclobacillus mengziensis]|uniref:MerR family transcriptional regulator n=1 Tax=Alicyclobacillus mengziensis TaxID=2931921 RepID=A0A9X7Z7K8_9BACL|nr:MerR family transcriptional regulator [Alicyclobacillus mengziensis]QSO47465.1 MerR family transcriptional regulator [Alicyclobacillus mengziensis]